MRECGSRSKKRESEEAINESCEQKEANAHERRENEQEDGELDNGSAG